MEESYQGPRTAVAVAVASPLGVQPDINSAGVSSSTGQPLGTMQLRKATPSAQCYGHVSPWDEDNAVVLKQVSESCIRQRRRLLSSAQVVTDVPFTSTAVKLHKKSSQEPSVCV